MDRYSKDMDIWVWKYVFPINNFRIQACLRYITSSVLGHHIKQILQ